MTRLQWALVAGAITLATIVVGSLYVNLAWAGALASEGTSTSRLLIVPRERFCFGWLEEMQDLARRKSRCFA
jgi:hypothetical protein